MQIARWIGTLAVLLGVLLSVLPADGATDQITVDLARQVAPVARAGINVDYLTDDDRLRPPGAASLGDALLGLGATFARYPGGEKSDSYLWSVPPLAEPIPTLARTGPDAWPSNDPDLIDNYIFYRRPPLDFDRFLAAASAAGAAPVVVVNLDSAFATTGNPPSLERLVSTAAMWVRYAHGRVRYWELGNESSKGSQNGRPTAGQYAAAAVQFARAMKAVDPTIQIGVNGGDAAWWAKVLPATAADIDFIVVHTYPLTNWSSFDTYRSKTNLVGAVESARAAIATYAPAAQRARLKIAVTEIGALNFGTSGWANAADLGHAVVLFDLVGQHLMQPDVLFTLVWTSRWVAPGSPYNLLTEANGPTPLGTALSLWRGGGTLLSVARSGTIRGYAVRNGASVKVALINPTTSRRTVTLRFSATVASQTAARQVFGGTVPSDLAPTLRTLAGIAVSGSQVAVTLDPVSVTLLTIQAP
jgi:hypothetical protein